MTQYVVDSTHVNPNGMEEVIGSIPIRSTNQTNNLERAFQESAELSPSGQPVSLFLGSSGQVNVKTVSMKPSGPDRGRSSKTSWHGTRSEEFHQRPTKLSSTHIWDIPHCGFGPCLIAGGAGFESLKEAAEWPGS
jgi:hypothetical protein